jgi:molecular chaperone Hsp33
MRAKALLGALGHPTMNHQDGILRALTDDYSFRVVTVATTRAVGEIVIAQHATGELASSLGELVTATLMVRETMAPEYRVQGILRGSQDSGTLVADSHPSGDLRGLVQLARPSETVAIKSGASLQVLRTLANGALQQGLVDFPPEGGVSQALMTYMQTSEQVTSVVGVKTVIRVDGVAGAGGYMVQLLPDATQSALRAMIERLERLGLLEQRVTSPGFSATSLMIELLAGIPHTVLGAAAVRYHCWCDEVRVMSALATLKRSDLEELLQAGEPLSLSCDYCHREYQIQPMKLKGLLEES